MIDQADARKPPPSYSVVIPAYNSSLSLEQLVTRLEQVFRERIGDTYEIILVDDGSPSPETWQTLQKLTHRHEQVLAVRLMRNFGKPGAELCGFSLARGRYVVSMDDDLQHLPEDLPNLIAEQNHDIVIGYFDKKQHSLFKNLASGIKGWFDYKLVGKPPHIKMGPYRLIKSEVVKAALTLRTPYPFIPGLLFYVTKDVVNVTVSHEPRKYGRSGFTLGKMVSNFSNLLVNNSSFLLRMMAYIGVSFSLISFAFGITVLVRTLAEGSSVPGWASLMVVLSMIGGMMLFAVGIIGEYLIRIINGLEQRPPFIIRDVEGRILAESKAIDAMEQGVRAVNSSGAGD